MCFQYVVDVFWTFFESVFNVFGGAQNWIAHFFAEKIVSEKGELIGNPVFVCCFSRKQMQEGNWAKKNISKSDKHIEHIPCNEAAEKLKARQRIRNSASTKSNPTVIFVDV